MLGDPMRPWLPQWLRCNVVGWESGVEGVALPQNALPEGMGWQRLLALTPPVPNV